MCAWCRAENETLAARVHLMAAEAQKATRRLEKKTVAAASVAAAAPMQAADALAVAVSERYGMELPELDLLVANQVSHKRSFINACFLYGISILYIMFCLFSIGCFFRHSCWNLCATWLCGAR